jgi:ADP-ribose pyrophosphatase
VRKVVRTMKLYEQQLSREVIHKGRIIDLYRDQVKLENGKETIREVVHHPGGVTVLALTDDHQVYVVRQFRYPFQKVLAELPAGKLEVGEDPLEAAKRELEEEAGIRASQWEDLGKLYPTVAYVDEVIHMYFAAGLTPAKQHLDEDEFLEAELVPLDELAEQVLNNEIPDAKTQAAVLKVWCRLQRK